MAPPIPIPADVRHWLKTVFADCNDRVAGTITQVPTIHEVPLDMTFIQHFLSVSASHRFPSGWTVEISTHYLGGGRHYGEWEPWPRRWEIADIGLLVIYRQGGKVLRSKVALLQSKRLYPDEQEFDEDVPLDYMIGSGRLFHSDDDWDAVTRTRVFSFTESSRYKALITGMTQYNAIASYEQAHLGEQPNPTVPRLADTEEVTGSIPVSPRSASAGTPTESSCSFPGRDARRLDSLRSPGAKARAR